MMMYDLPPARGWFSFSEKFHNNSGLTSENRVDNIRVDKALDGWYAERDTKSTYKQTRNASNV